MGNGEARSLKRAVFLYAAMIMALFVSCAWNIASLRQDAGDYHLHTARNIFMLLDNMSSPGAGDGKKTYNFGRKDIPVEMTPQMAFLALGSDMSPLKYGLEYGAPIKFKVVEMNHILGRLAPDEFEKQALERFKGGTGEYYEDNISASTFRYVGAMSVATGCNTCHPASSVMGDAPLLKGMRSFDGGVSITLDTIVETASFKQQVIYLIIVHLMITGFVLFGMYRYGKVVRENERELKEANGKLSKTNAQLVGLMKVKVNENIQQADLLRRQARFAAMGEMIGIIAHQWRQPLNALGLFVQDLEDSFRYGELNAKYIAEMVEKSMAQIGYMSKTIDDFRNFFQPNRAEGAFDLTAAVGEIVALVEPALRSRMINVVLDLKNVQVYGYINEFKQALLNIINNSSDALAATVPVPIVGKSARQIAIYNRISDDLVEFYVEDSGGGIPPDVMDRVFDPYFTTKEEGKGTGIGLYMTKLIIEKHMKGTINITNTEVGVKVMIILKVHTEGSAAILPEEYE